MKKIYKKTKEFGKIILPNLNFFFFYFSCIILNINLIKSQPRRFGLLIFIILSLNNLLKKKKF